MPLLPLSAERRPLMVGKDNSEPSIEAREKNRTGYCIGVR